MTACLADWGPPLLPLPEFSTLEGYRRLWRSHREELLEITAERRPGTAPYVAYLLGEIPLPEIKHPTVAGDFVHRVDDITVAPRWNYFGRMTGGWKKDGEDAGERRWLNTIGYITGT